jgi:hypothetical protein
MNKLRAVLLMSLATTATAQTQNPVAKAAADARTIQRVAEASRRDFPASVVPRIAEEDLDLLRGKRSDGTYQYAHYERQEGGRQSDRFAVKSSSEDSLDKIDFSAERAYRLIISVPNRRLLVARNRRAYIDHVEFEYSPFNAGKQLAQVDVKSWLSVGDQKTVDLPDIARRGRARVFARVDEADGGPATIELTLLQARLVDNPDSPYFASVPTVVSLARAAEHNDLASVKTYSADLVSRLGGSSSSAAAVPCIPTVSDRPLESRVSVTPESMPSVEIYLELQGIEDLLTGTEGERRDGIDKLHQLIRRLRPTTR